MSRRNQIKRNKTTLIQAEASDLCSDVVYNILSRLPAKSLLRFKSVCKSWKALISDHLFTQAHLKQSKIMDQQKIFSLSCEVDRFELVNFLLGHKTLVEKLDYPVKRSVCARVLCSSDGLVLCKGWSSRNRIYVLWNTSARMYTKFICPYQISPFQSVHGISFDSLTNDYKVVVIFDKYYVVYSLKNNSWSRRKGFSYAGISQQPGVNINGALYWVVIQSQMHIPASKAIGHYLMLGKYVLAPNCFPSWNGNFYEYDNCYSHEIVCFDPKEEKLKNLRTPKPVSHTDVFYVTDLRGRLGLYRYSIDRKLIEIWLRTGHDSDLNSWVEFMNIENMPASHVYRPLCLMQENEVLLIVDSEELAIYNCKQKEIHLIPCFPELKFLEVVVCQDSLLLPTLGNDKRRRWRASEEPKNGNQDCAGTGANKTGKRGRANS